jgi:hypothetical protein
MGSGYHAPRPRAPIQPRRRPMLGAGHSRDSRLARRELAYILHLRNLGNRLIHGLDLEFEPMGNI